MDLNFCLNSSVHGQPVTALELRDRALLDSVLSVTPMDPVSLPPPSVPAPYL